MNISNRKYSGANYYCNDLYSKYHKRERTGGPGEEYDWQDPNYCSKDNYDVRSIALNRPTHLIE